MIHKYNSGIVAESTPFKTHRATRVKHSEASVLPGGLQAMSEQEISLSTGTFSFDSLKLFQRFQLSLPLRERAFTYSDHKHPEFVFKRTQRLAVWCFNRK